MNRFAAGHGSGTRSAVLLFVTFLANRTLATFRNGPAVAGDRIAAAAVLGTTGVIVLAGRLGSRYVRRRRNGPAAASGRRREAGEARPLAGAG